MDNHTTHEFTRPATTVAGLIAYLSTLPPSAEVYIEPQAGDPPTEVAPGCVALCADSNFDLRWVVS